LTRPWFNFDFNTGMLPSEVVQELYNLNSWYRAFIGWAIKKAKPIDNPPSRTRVFNKIIGWTLTGIPYGFKPYQPNLFIVEFAVKPKIPEIVLPPDCKMFLKPELGILSEGPNLAFN